MNFEIGLNDTYTVRSTISKDTDDYDNDKYHKICCCWGSAQEFDSCNEYPGYDNYLRNSLANELDNIYCCLEYDTNKHNKEYLEDLNNLEKVYRLISNCISTRKIATLKFICKNYLLKIDIVGLNQ